MSIDELLRGVRIALGIDAAESCAALDWDRNGAVTIEELIRGVRAALAGCSVSAGPRSAAKRKRRQKLVVLPAGRVELIHTKAEGGSV